MSFLITERKTNEICLEIPQSNILLYICSSINPIKSKLLFVNERLNNIETQVKQIEDKAKRN